ncbi:unnamed protein product, partial [marine sediment metagenome]
PTINAFLANDTGPGGVPNQDGITSDPTIAATVTVVPALNTLTAWIGDEPSSISIRGLVQANGSLVLTPTVLQQLNGGPLVDGQYIVHFKGVDELAHESTATVSMRLDRTTTAPERPDLPTSSDTGFDNSDNLTRIAGPPISVAAEPGSTVTLLIDDQPILTQVANPTAMFTLPALASGTYQITARSIDSAGNPGGLSPPLALTIRREVPVVTMIIAPFQDDLTPVIDVSVTDAA